MSDAVIIMLVGFLVAVNSGITGSFMVLRKLSMIGDAISHAVLPGIIIAYMIAGHRENFFFLFGAAVMGVFVTLMIDWFNKKGRLPTDASIGLSFTFLFAVGIILISAFTESVDIDADCVLYGEISLVPFHKYTLMGFDIGTKALWDNLIILIIILLFVILRFRPLAITSFNEEYGQSIGIPVRRIRLFLMVLVSLTTVFAFESVGAVLVVAFLVIPPATACISTTKTSQSTMLLRCSPAAYGPARTSKRCLSPGRARTFRRMTEHETDDGRHGIRRVGDRIMPCQYGQRCDVP
jgi:manganese/zinc/iron transport system permease protein